MDEKPPAYDPGPNPQSYQHAGGYPPQQPGYPPAGGYPPPPDAGYQQQPGGYPPPPDGGYQQQPGGYPPQKPGAPPSDGGYPGGYQQPQPATVVVQPVVVGAVAFGEHGQMITCPKCYQSVVTSTEYEAGTLTWLIVGVLCIVGCWLCCWIPCVADGCKDVTHRCPNCQEVVGNYRRM